ncbi:MAG: protein kinase [Candidatus Eisenbacteria sp.]|nr:protein kinase [Candidatus Eisenbacteria bacterium]
MIGKTISHYKILEKIGEGGMGVVYKAEDTKLKRTVVLKFLPSDLTCDADCKERFVNEAQAAAALNHPNIVTIHEIDETEGQVFIAMELVEGRSLQDMIAEAGTAGRSLPDINQAIDIAGQICKGLDKAHGAGIVHRDIKPANILVDPDGQVRILDFGIAKLRGVSALTKETSTLGTVHYMSPEQTRGESVDHRTDIWAVGAVLYELLAGLPPFKGDYEQAVIYSILNEDPEPVTSMRSDAPEGLAKILARALAKNPEERYQNLGHMLADLRALEEGAELAETREILRDASPRRRKRVYLYPGISVLLLLLLLSQAHRLTWRAPAVDSLAVLPLGNLSGDPNQEYIADGMTQALIMELSRIKALRVISRTSVMRYKETDKSLPEIAKELDVDVVVEGSAMLAGNQIRITAQLIDATTDQHLWAESYEREFRDVLALQKEVARAIAGEIRIALTPEEQERLASAPPVNPEAHEAYLKGIFHRNKLTFEGIDKAIGYFEEALDLDPDYAPAHVGLALCYDDLTSLGRMPGEEAWPKVKAQAMRALEIDPTEVEAHALIADVKFLHDWDWEGAEAEFKRAIELNPGHLTAHGWYAMYLIAMGRFDEAVMESRKAVEIDPLSIGMQQNLAVSLRYASRYDEAEEQMREILDMDPDLAIAHLGLGIIYTDQGKHAQAIQEIEKVMELVGYGLTAPLLARAHALSGNRSKAEEILENVARLSSEERFLPLHMAGACAALGRDDQAMEWLERAYDQRQTHMVFLRVNPAFRDLHSDPRFIALLEKMRLE